MKRRIKTDFLDSLEARPPPRRFCLREGYQREQFGFSWRHTWTFLYSDGATESLTKWEKIACHVKK